MGVSSAKYGKEIFRTKMCTAPNATATQLVGAWLGRKHFEFHIAPTTFPDATTMYILVGTSAADVTAGTNCHSLVAGRNASVFSQIPNPYVLDNWTGEVWVLHGAGFPVQFDIVETGWCE